MNASILAIDDDRGILAIYESVLGKAGYDVETATRGLEGVEKARLKRPDIAFIDLHMPGINGIETIFQLRDMYPSLPVYIVTAFYGTFTKLIREAAHNNVEFELFHKPVSASQLREAVEQICGERVPTTVVS